MNGVELCSNITSPNLKKILLTAIAGDDTAVEAFNDGIIDRFISKGEDNLDDKLYKQIIDLQFDLFAEQSLNVFKLYENNIEQKPFLRQKPFLKWFKQLTASINAQEYYLVTEFSQIDYLIVSYSQNKKQYHWLSIRDDNDIKALTDIAQASDAPKEVLSKLENKTAIPIVINDDDNDCSPEDWENIMHPLESAQVDDSTIYYVIVNDIKKTVADL